MTTMQRTLIVCLSLCALFASTVEGQGCTGDRVYCFKCTNAASRDACVGGSSPLEECKQADPICRRVSKYHATTYTYLGYDSECTQKQACIARNTGGGNVPLTITDCEQLDKCENAPACQYSEWTAFGDCSKDCDSGAKQRQRTADASNTAGCNDSLVETQACNTQPCPRCNYKSVVYEVGQEITDHDDKDCKKCICTTGGIACSPIPGKTVNGTWSSWYATGGCSKTCGKGTEPTSRTCTPPQCDGLPCTGDTTSTRSCKLRPCPMMSPPIISDAPDMCKCRVRGDPIVETFDDNWGLIDGAGEYIVARSRRPGCEWILTITVARVNGRWVIVKVTLYYRGKTYSGGDSGLEVDGVPTTIPFDDGNMKVNPNPGGMIGEIDQCKVVFMVNGANLRKTLTVIMRDPPMYVGYVDGMCGFCNGNPDDDVLLKNGDPIGTDEFRFKRWGQSWQKP